MMEKSISQDICGFVGQEASQGRLTRAELTTTMLQSCFIYHAQQNLVPLAHGVA